MGIGLTAAKPVFKASIMSALNTELYTILDKYDKRVENELSKIVESTPKPIVSSDGEYNKAMKAYRDSIDAKSKAKRAEILADTCTSIANNLSTSITDAVEAFIKELLINIVVPPTVMATVATPTGPGTGPCSGTIPPTSITLN